MKQNIAEECPDQPIITGRAGRHMTKAYRRIWFKIHTKLFRQGSGRNPIRRLNPGSSMPDRPDRSYVYRCKVNPTSSHVARRRSLWVQQIDLYTPRRSHLLGVAFLWC